MSDTEWTPPTGDERDAWLREQQPSAGTAEHTSSPDPRTLFLRELRENSAYFFARAFVWFAATVSSVAVLILLWPFTATDVDFALFFACGGLLLVTTMVRALATAFLDRCDLAVRRAFEEQRK